MWIKICANTNLPDARLAASLGANALGFVFAASKRRVTAAEVARITSELPTGFERVGVFDTQTASEIVGAVREAALSGVQLHARLDREMVARLAGELGPAVTLTQTVSWAVDPSAAASAADVERQLRELAELPAITRVLVDSRVGSTTGGTGVPFRWRDAARVLREQQGRTHLILAGGLRPDNVAEAIRTLEPWGVDVASGVEASPGQKDASKMERFFAQVRGGKANGFDATQTDPR